MSDPVKIVVKCGNKTSKPIMVESKKFNIHRLDSNGNLSNASLIKYSKNEGILVVDNKNEFKNLCMLLEDTDNFGNKNGIIDSGDYDVLKEQDIFGFYASEDKSIVESVPSTNNVYSLSFNNKINETQTNGEEKSIVQKTTDYIKNLWNSL